jgi:sporulation protein YlmC with PRC-barrel domain
LIKAAAALRLDNGHPVFSRQPRIESGAPEGRNSRRPDVFSRQLFSNRKTDMVLKYLVGGFTASVLMATVAFAQTPATAATDRADIPAAATSFQGDWRTSKVVGLKIYNDNGNSLGSIEDLLTDKDGTIKAVVIGVGGFLGVGEHLVAVPFDQIKFVNEPVSATSASSTSDTSDRPMSSTTTGAATTNTVPTGSAPAMKANSNPWYPDHAVFNATKDELKAMPEFKYST